MTTTTQRLHPAVAADRAAQRRRRNDAHTRLAIQVVAVWTAGWWLMLAIGIIHHDWITTCPTLGYGKSVLLAALLRAALIPVSEVRGNNR